MFPVACAIEDASSAEVMSKSLTVRLQTLLTLDCDMKMKLSVNGQQKDFVKLFGDK